MKETKFKQTEVGMIPSDWDVKPLDKFANLITKGTTPTSIGDNFVDNGVNFVKIESLTKFSEIDCTKVAYISENTHKKLFRSQLQTNDLLVSIAGALGRTAIVKQSDLPANTNQALSLVRLKKDCLLDVGYLKEWINSNIVQSFIADKTVVGAQPNISLQNVRDFPIATPPFEEQKRIAQALSDVDAVISTTEKLIAKKKALKQGAMQQLLTGKVRLGFQTKDERRKTSDFTCHSGAEGDRIQGKYKMTELGLIPEDWQVKRLGDEVILSTETFESAQYKKEFYVGTENMLQDKAGITKNETVNPIGKAKGFKRNDILMSNIRPYLKKIWYANRDGICSNDVLVYRVAKNAIDSSFLYSILSDDNFFAYVMENAVGTKMPRGDKKIIREYLFACPPTKEEQTSIATVLSDMDSEIAALETKLAKYRQLKTGMMQQLLTGKIRLIK